MKTTNPTASFTPGPWSIRKNSKIKLLHKAVNIEHESDGLRSIVAIVNDDFLCPEHGDFIANSRLIRSAPDLLAALERMVGNCTRYLEERPIGDAEMASDGPSALQQARSAIARAKGDES